MSRKGNSPDNGMMESFFDSLKYSYEKSFKSLDNLEEQATPDYIFITTINVLRPNLSLYNIELNPYQN